MCMYAFHVLVSAPFPDTIPHTHTHIHQTLDQYRWPLDVSTEIHSNTDTESFILRRKYPKLS